MLLMNDPDYFTKVTATAPMTLWLARGITIKTTTTG